MSAPLFTEDEWNAAMPGVVASMTDYLRPFCTAIYEDRGDHGVGWGSGSYLRLGDDVFILTNEHVAIAREQDKALAHQFAGQNDIRRIAGNHVALPAPLDLALLPVDIRAWADQTNASKAIEIDQISLVHETVPTEILTFTGFAGQNVTFHFNTLFAESTCYTAREIELPESQLFSERYHFGLDYRPDLASQIIGNSSLPVPPGFSGSTVWNTGFVEAKILGVTWTPEMAQVTGVVWGWPSSDACLLATRAEYLRSFLLSAVSQLKSAPGK
jgi:hypothetical protein